MADDPDIHNTLYDDPMDIQFLDNQGGDPWTSSYDHPYVVSESFRSDNLHQVWAMDSDDTALPSSKLPYVEPEPFSYNDSLGLWAADSDDEANVQYDGLQQLWTMDSDDQASDDVLRDPNMFIPDHDEAEEDVEGTYRERHPYLTGMCLSTPSRSVLIELQVKYAMNLEIISLLGVSHHLSLKSPTITHLFMIASTSSFPTSSTTETKCQEATLTIS